MHKRLITNPKTLSILRRIHRVLLILIGSFVLAIGTGIFLVPFELNTGGVSGITIILENYTSLSVDIWSYIIHWSLFFIGLLVLGVDFSLKTLISTIFYPIFLSIVIRTNMGISIVNLLLGVDAAFLENGVLTIPDNILNTVEIGRVILAVLFGSGFVGMGCGITFIGGGSTGGIDIIAFICKKFLKTDVAIITLVCDSTVVIVGLIISLANYDSRTFTTSLIGIVGAFVCSFFIYVIYNGTQNSMICDIITSKVDEVQDYVVKRLDRTTTVFKVIGGYSKEDKTMLRVVVNRREYPLIRDALSNIDPDAFITFASSNLVTGEGFEKNENKNETLITDVKKQIKKIKGKKRDGK